MKAWHVHGSTASPRMSVGLPEPCIVLGVSQFIVRRFRAIRITNQHDHHNSPQWIAADTIDKIVDVICNSTFRPYDNKTQFYRGEIAPWQDSYILPPVQRTNVQTIDNIVYVNCAEEQYRFYPAHFSYNENKIIKWRHLANRPVLFARRPEQVQRRHVSTPPATTLRLA
jgi:hypothetical protein